MMKLFDTHAHLSDKRFDDDLDDVIKKLKESQVFRVVDVCCHVKDVKRTLDLTKKHDFIYGALGMHPHEASDVTEKTLYDMEGLLKKNDKLIALGEIGLDYHYDFSPRDVQKKWFIEQLELAISLNLPVILHIREAFSDCMEILRAHKKGLFGVMHCYSGSYETARDCIDMGLYIAFGGAVTFKNARRLSDVASRLPLKRLLIETDCPYMTPEPHRGKRNDPSYVYYVAKCLAELHNRDVEEVCDITLKNGLELFSMGK